MGNFTSTVYLPSPRTAANKLLFWISVKFGWKEVEVSDHRRAVIKTTFTLDRQSAPAVSLRQRVRSRMDRNPNTMGVIWTNPGQVTTAVTLTMEYV